MTEPTDTGTRRARGDSGGTGPDTGQLKSAMYETAESAKSAGREQLESRKEAAAEQAEHLADAINRVGIESGYEGQQTVASYAADLASGLEKFADTLRRKSVNELASEVQMLARRNPALFIAGSIGVGFAVARFLKASQSHSHSGERVEPGSADDFSAPVSARDPGAAVGSAVPDPERTPQRSEYSAVDAASSEPPESSFATDNPDIAAARPTGAGSGPTRSGTLASEKRESDHG